MAAERLANTTLGKYRLIEQLGQGGMAEVYKAFQSGLGRYVAVKVIRPSLAEDQDFLVRFQREAQLVASLRHPNIVQVFDFDVENGLYYMVTEFIDGLTLKAHLQKLERQNRWISIGESARITLAVGSALKYAHRAGIVHRDIKPSNVMIDKQNNVILTDFGIAKILSSGEQAQLTTTGTMVGTPAYMSPELGMGQHGDARSDIYSLGVMLYQLVTAQLPYVADTPMGVVFKHINTPLPRPRQVNANVPESMERIILRAMAKHPDDRYQQMGELLNDLQRATGISSDETSTPTLRQIPSSDTVMPIPKAIRAAPPAASAPISAPPKLEQQLPTLVAPPSAVQPGVFECAQCNQGLLADDGAGTLTCPHCHATFVRPERVCPRCEAVNAMDAQRCVACGEKLKKPCARCGTLNWTLASHCQDCGASLDMLEFIAARRAQTDADRLQSLQADATRFKEEAEQALQKRREQRWAQENARRQALAKRQAQQQRRERLLLIGVALFIIVMVILFLVFVAQPELRLR